MAPALLNALVFGLVVLLLCAIGLAAAAPETYDPNVTDQEEFERIKRMRAARALAQDPSSSYARPADASADFKEYTSSVQIVVLGDIGHSPRMQRHAISLANHGAYVNVVGYLDSELYKDLQKNPRVRITPLPRPSAFFQTKSRLLFTLLGPLKVVRQTLTLISVLGFQTRPTKLMLVQNPPSIPVLAIARAISWLRGTQLIVDWHNFGWSILSLRLGISHPLVKLARVYEDTIASSADHHFAVTTAMSHYMHRTMGVTAFPLHDRPAPDFQPLSTAQRLSVLRRLDVTSPHADAIVAGKTRLLVSSTSWTPDEDFSILLSALETYASAKATSAPRLSSLLVVITGKGPQKKDYLSRITSLKSANKLDNIAILTPWLPFADYAALLGAADLGISLHMSSSGLDLPMKVVDMFGAGLPVVGYADYESWPELVTEGVNGRGFKTREELARLLVDLLSDAEALAVLRDGAVKESARRWDEEWDAVAGAQIFFPEGVKGRDID